MSEALSTCISCGQQYDPVESIGRLQCVFHPGKVIERGMPCKELARQNTRWGHYSCCNLSFDRRDYLHFEERAIPGCVHVDHCESKEELDSVRTKLYHPIPRGLLKDRITRLLVRGLAISIDTKSALLTKIPVVAYPGYEHLAGNANMIEISPLAHYNTLRASLLKDSIGAVLPLRRLLPDSYSVSLAASNKALRSGSPFYPLYSSKLRMAASGDEVSSSVLSGQRSATSLMTRSQKASEAEVSKRHVSYWKEAKANKMATGGVDSPQEGAMDDGDEDDDGDDEEEEDDAIPDELRIEKNITDIDPECGGDFGASGLDSRLYYEGEEAMTPEKMDEIGSIMDVATRSAAQAHRQSLRAGLLSQQLTQDKAEGIKNFVPFYLVRRVALRTRHECDYIISNRDIACRYN